MTEKIYIGIDGRRIEAEGEVLEQILKDRAEYQAEQSRIEAEKKAKEEASNSAFLKLKNLGLTDSEIAAITN